MKMNYSQILITILMLLLINTFIVKAQKRHSSITQINSLDKTNIKDSSVKLQTMFVLENQSLNFSKIKSVEDNLGFLIETYIPIINGSPLDLNIIKVISKDDQILRVVGSLPKWTGENNVPEINKLQAFEKCETTCKG